ncbi:MAG: matrixin family metalloprotease, partial [Pseudomonadota bacterium]
MLSSLGQAAINSWETLGVFDAEQIDRLNKVEFQLADLPGDQLGEAVDGLVTLDLDGAGLGWFVDSTPAEHSEFSVLTAHHALWAAEDSPAYGKVDLLTVVSHEFGHVLGLSHPEEDNEHELLMEATLLPGLRRLPTAEDITAV